MFKKDYLQLIDEENSPGFTAIASLSRQEKWYFVCY